MCSDSFGQEARTEKFLLIDFCYGPSIDKIIIFYIVRGERLRVHAMYRHSPIHGGPYAGSHHT